MAEDSYNSDIDNGCMLFPVFSQVEIPDPTLLDRLILSSRRGLAHIDEGAQSAALIFLNSLAPGSIIERGSHVPMQRFPEHPWAGKPVSEMYAFFKENIQGLKDGISDHNFAVVDERTLKDGTLLLCSDSTPPADTTAERQDEAGADVPAALATQRADGYCSLHTMVPDEMGTKPLRDYEAYHKKGRKGEFVLTEQYIMFDDEQYLAGVQAKRARGEPLREPEKRLTGLDDYQGREGGGG